MNHTIPEESVIVDGEVYAQHIAINQNYHHPTGEFIPLSAEDKQQTLLHRWSRIVRRFAFSPALEEGDRRVSYAAFNTLANHIAHTILARSVPKDIPVAALFDIESDLQIGLFAIWKAGNFFVWLEPEQPPERSQYIVEDSGALLVVTNKKNAALARQFFPGEGQVIVIEELPANLPLFDPPITIDASSPAYLSYTSASTDGSKDKPQGIIELHRNLVATLAVQESIFHFSTHDRVAYTGHGSGWSDAAAAALMYGGTSLAFNLRQEGPVRLLQWLKESRITILLGGPAVRLLLSSLDGSEEFPTLRVISGGGEAMYLEQMLAYQQYLPDSCVMGNTYSTNECRSITLLIVDKNSRFEDRVLPAGFPTLHAEVEIWNDRDRPVRADETGDIIAITPYAVEGYWKSPELTASRFGVDWQDRRYFRTGDVGWLDKQGCLWILERVEEAVESPEVAGNVGIIVEPETSENLQTPTSLAAVDELVLPATFAIAQTLDVLEISEVEERPAEIEAPAVTANQETAESLELDKPLETQERDEIVETPEPTETLEAATILTAVETLETIENAEVTEIPESAANVEIEESVETPTNLELTETSDTTEIPETVETLELTEIPELVETHDVVETPDAIAILGAVAALKIVEATQVAEDLELREIPDTVVTPEVIDVQENLELSEIPATTELPEIVASDETATSAEVEEIVEEEIVEGEIGEEATLEAIESAAENEIPEVEETPVALGMLDVVEQQEATENPELTEIPEAIEIPETPVNLDVPESDETPDILPEVLGAAMILGLSEIPETVETPVTAETVEAPVTPELTEFPETTEVPEIAETHEGVETSDAVAILGAVAALKMVGATQEAEKPELSEIPEATETLEVQTPEIVESLDATETHLLSENAGSTEIPENIEILETPESFEATELSTEPELLEAVETLEVQATLEPEEILEAEVETTPETVETPELQEGVDTPESLELTEISETIELPDVVASVEVPENLDLTEESQSSETRDGAESLERLAIAGLIMIPEETEIPETVESLAPEIVNELVDESVDESGETPIELGLTEIPETAEVPEEAESLDTRAILALAAASGLAVDPELAETAEPTNIVESFTTQQEAASFESTEIPETTEVPEIVASDKRSTSVEVEEIVEEETVEAAGIDMIEGVAAPWILETSETAEATIEAETMEALEATNSQDALKPLEEAVGIETDEVLEATESHDTSEILEIATSPETTPTLEDEKSFDASESLGAAAIAGLIMIPDASEFPEMREERDTLANLESTESAEESEIPEVKETPVASNSSGEMLDVTEQQEATENPELTEIPEAIEIPETPVSLDAPESDETPDVLPELLEAAVILGLSEIPETVETPLTTETVEAPTSLKATEIPETTEVPEVAETHDVAETSDAIAILGAVATLKMVGASQEAEKPELSEIPEATETPEVVETPEIVESLDVTEVPEAIITPETSEAINAPENLELSEIPATTELPEIVASDERSTSAEVEAIVEEEVTLEATESVEPSPTLEAEDILKVAATTQAVESLESPPTPETNENLQAVEALLAIGVLQSTLAETPATIETPEDIDGPVPDTPAIIAPLVEKPIEPLFIATKAYEQAVKVGEQHQAYFTGEYVPMTPGEMQSTLLHRWEQMVARFGANAALEEPGRTLTYTEFNIQANRIAHAILSRNVAKDVPVALLVDVEGDLPIGMIAIWKAGNFYLWLEAEQPLAANRSIVEDSGATVVVTNRNYEAIARQLWPSEDAVIVVEDLASRPPFNPPITINGESPAYLMYTSAGTGKPTGVLDLHRNLVHALAVRQDIFRYTTDERFALMTRGSALPSIVGAALMVGGCLLPFNPVKEGILRFNQWLIARRITTIADGPFLRSWLLSLDGRQKFPELRHVTAGGGPIYREHVAAYQRFLPDSCILSSTYSATEVQSVAVMIADKSTRVETRLVAAGSLLPPATVEIWDERNRSVSVDEAGEIIVFTPFAAQGYWKSPALTAGRFGVDAQGRRYYRTGDLGRLDKQGQLWVLGRVDGQVKIRGYRVEPAEIEAALLELPNVQEAAVIPVGESDESRQLAAYVGSTAKMAEPDLHKRLGMLMPAFMVPATIMVVDKLPRTLNGIVDLVLLRQLQGGPILPRPSVTEQPPAPSEADSQPESSQPAVTEVAPVKVPAPKVDMVLPQESVIVNGEIFVQHVKLGEQNYHPTGEHVPITPAEQEKTLLHRFSRMVERFDSNPAIEEGNRVLSYIEFNALANRIAHALIARKPSPKQPIAVLCDMESDLYIGAFAVWKAGLFFVWIEPQQPLALNKSIVEDSGATVVITTRKHADLACQLFSDPTGIFVAEEMTSGYASYDPDITLEPSSPAYLMYTSDSAGKPKGVLEVHRNLIEGLVVRQSFLHFSNQDRVLHLSAASGLALAACAALMYGGCVLPYQALDEGPVHLSQWLIDRRITIAGGGAILRPWLMSLDGSQQFPNLRLVCLDDGASYQQQMLAYQRNLSDRCLLLISYSATECRTATLLVIDKSCRIPSRLLPAGFPTAHVAIEIWGALKQQLPVGETGEVVVFTPFAAQGYWNSPELTKSQFGVDAKGRRYYLTGDLGRLDENGALWVLGRKAGQVKIGGNRVDLAEVEVALMDVPNVKEVALIHSGATDETRVLTAFVTSSTRTTGKEVRKEVETRLPSYMVPATVTVLEEFPRTANGKIDRAMLQDVAAGVGKITIKKPVRAAAPAIRAATERNVDQPLETQQPSLSLPRHYKSAYKIDAVQVMPGAPRSRPIFLCPGGNGSLKVVRRYQQLIGRLGNQRPLYGLVAADSDEANGLYKNIDELVAAALFALRRIQAHGPYRLIGEGVGGKLAYEMARRLEKEGERVALLALLDAPFRGNGNWLQRFFNGLRGKSGGQGANLATYALRSKEDPAHLAQRRYLEILKKFKPAKSYSSPTLAVFTHQYEHHRRRWQKVLPAIKVTIVEGTHGDYLRVSGGKVLGLLRQAIDDTPAPQKEAVNSR